MEEILDESNQTLASCNEDFEGLGFPPIDINELIEFTKEDIIQLPNAVDNITLGDYIDEGAVCFTKSVHSLNFRVISICSTLHHFSLAQFTTQNAEELVPASP